jgi:hypothetical protein
VIFCLLGAFVTQISAQNTEKAKKWYVYEYWWSPIFCNGEYVNDVMGDLKVHFLLLMDEYGNVIGEKTNVKGTVTDRYGEQYKYKEHHSVFDWFNSTCEYTYHLIGDRGTKYRGTLFMDFSDGWGEGLIIIPGKTFCR